MDARWMPRLTVAEQGGRCRLQLTSDAWGDGATLQEAADDLIARVLRQANALRGGGWNWGSELSPRDRRWLDFLFEVGEIDERGGDVRNLVMGFPPAS
jgi:hypothetical protein